MSNARHTFLSAVWNHAGRILEYVLMYLTAIFIARGLGVEENGRFVGLFSISQLLIVLSSLGLETSLNKFIPQLGADSTDAQGRFMLRRVLLLRIGAFAVAAFLFAGFVYLVPVPFLDQNRHVLAAVVCFSAIRSLVPLFAMVLTARLQTAVTALINVAIRALELAVIFWLATVNFTVENLFLVFLVSSTLHVAAYAVLARKTVFGSIQPVAMRPVVAFASLFWVNTVVDFVLGRQGDVLLLANLHPDRAQASMYDVAYSIAQLAAMALTVGLSGVMFATFARLAVEDQQKMDRFYRFSIRIVSLLSVPAFCFVMANAEAILHVLYSSRYVAAAPFVVIILVFRVVSRLFGGPENAEYLLSRGRVGTVVSIGIIAASVNVVLNILLIPRWGAAGSVIAGGAANLLVNMLGALMVFKLSPNRLQLGFWLKLALVSGVGALVARLLVSGQDLATLVGGGLVFVTVLSLSLVAIKPLTSGDAEWLSFISKRLEKVLGHLTSSSSEPVQTKPTTS